MEDTIRDMMMVRNASTRYDGSDDSVSKKLTSLMLMINSHFVLVSNVEYIEFLLFLINLKDFMRNISKLLFFLLSDKFPKIFSLFSSQLVVCFQF